MNEKKTYIKILVACHKPDSFIPQDEIYMPIQVGKALHPELDLGFQYDNVGENISEKNSTYCELTALYWAWKNLPKDIEYIGLAHYRRFFSFQIKLRPFESIKAISEVDFKIESLIIPNLSTLFNKVDFILAKPYYAPFPLEVEYNYAHIKNDFELLRNAILTVSPEYIPTFDKFMYRNNKIAAYNMMITSRLHFDAYCDWLFSVLDEVEKHVKISDYADQARVFGYMAERLLNIFVLHNNMRIRYTPVIKIDKPDNKSIFKLALVYLRNKITSRLLYRKR